MNRSARIMKISPPPPILVMSCYGEEGEGLMTCYTWSCTNVLYRPAPVRLQLFCVTRPRNNNSLDIISHASLVPRLSGSLGTRLITRLLK